MGKNKSGAKQGPGIRNKTEIRPPNHAPTPTTNGTIEKEKGNDLLRYHEE
jgi:hypothetical protein